MADEETDRKTPADALWYGEQDEAGVDLL